MVLDPLSALSLASNVVQFIDFGNRLISEIQEIRQSASGLAKENIDFLFTAEAFRRKSDILFANPTDGIGSSSLPLSRSALQEFAVPCRQVSDELIAILEGLKVMEPRKRQQSFRQALRSITKRRKIKELVAKMGILRKLVDSHLITILRSLLPFLDFWRFSNLKIATSLPQYWTLCELFKRTISVCRLRGIRTSSR